MTNMNTSTNITDALLWSFYSIDANLSSDKNVSNILYIICFKVNAIPFVNYADFVTIVAINTDLICIRMYRLLSKGQNMNVIIIMFRSSIYPTIIMKTEYL